MRSPCGAAAVLRRRTSTKPDGAASEKADAFRQIEIAKENSDAIVGESVIMKFGRINGEIRRALAHRWGRGDAKACSFDVLVGADKNEIAVNQSSATLRACCRANMGKLLK